MKNTNRQNPWLLAGLMALLLWSSSAASALISRDLFNAGDGKITFDPATNLEWLDLPLTTNLGYVDIMAGAGGWTSLGFRYALTSDVSMLYAHAGLYEHSSMIADDFPAVWNLMQKLGLTLPSYSIGLTGELAREGYPYVAYPGRYVAYLTFGAYGATSVVAKGPAYGDGYTSPELGNFLVRDAAPISVPEPAPYFLIGAGLVIMFAMEKLYGFQKFSSGISEK